MFISVIFERLARKDWSSYGKIITHAEVSMIESIYGQNGKIVLFPSGTLQFPYFFSAQSSFSIFVGFHKKGNQLCFHVDLISST